MTRQRKTRRTIGIDARIQAARDAVARAKARHEKAVEALKSLLDRRDEMCHKRQVGVSYFFSLSAVWRVFHSWWSYRHR